MCTSVCVCVCVRLRVFAGAESFSKESRQYLESIKSDTMDEADQDLHLCLTMCKLEIDFMAPVHGGKRMWKGGTQ